MYTFLIEGIIQLMSAKQTTPEHKAIKDYYENTYYRNAGTAATTVNPHLKQLAQRVNITANQHVLDIACGQGDFLFACSEQGATLSGIDISDKAIAVCKQRLPQGQFHSGVAEELPFADNTFNFISCLGALEHFLDPLQSLREMQRVAKPDARFLLLVPNLDFLTKKIGLFAGTDQKDAKEELRTLEGWAELFAQGGLTIEQRWKDLHIFQWSWLKQRKWYRIPHLALQGFLLTVWPLRWQYQVYHLCVKKALPQ